MAGTIHSTNTHFYRINTANISVEEKENDLCEQARGTRQTVMVEQWPIEKQDHIVVINHGEGVTPRGVSYAPFRRPYYLQQPTSGHKNR